MDALGHNQSSFARLVESSPSGMNNYLKGLRRPELDMAIRTAAKTGVTLDWIYLGDRSGLPARMLALLPDLSVPARKAK